MSFYYAEETGAILQELEASIAEASVTYGTPGKLFWRSLQSIRFEVERAFGDLTWATAAQIAQAALESYWLSLQWRYGAALPFQQFTVPASEEWQIIPDDSVILSLARGLGRLAGQTEPVAAGYWLGEIYTQLLPASQRAQFGVYYTPPALTIRLLTSLQKHGVNWITVRVLDPACGGGAFLAPVALEMRRALQHMAPGQVLDHIALHLKGLEIDAFGAWMSQVMLEATLYDLCVTAGRRLPQVVETRDALKAWQNTQRFDVVIGNPPYGRVTLSQELRAVYERSVYGHANLYGLFMDLAVRLAAPHGLIALVTPTSFLGGQYFRNLRALMIKEAPPVAIDLVSSRKGVFTDVLQETLLGIYQRLASGSGAQVAIVELVSESEATVQNAGSFLYPENHHSPWLLPRAIGHDRLIERLHAMPHRLRDYGYKVSTGPLVWNRHKDQLADRQGRATYPIVWAESITRDGRFVYRTDKKNHAPFLRTREEDEWLITRQGCVLVQRTTAKEQHRRLIAAELPQEFIDQYGGVSVENHLNMVKPVNGAPAISAQVLAALLNSGVVDQVFRCISGSVAVSASELESLPLPSPGQAATLNTMLMQEASPEQIDKLIQEMYIVNPAYASA